MRTENYLEEKRKLFHNQLNVTLLRIEILKRLFTFGFYSTEEERKTAHNKTNEK